METTNIELSELAKCLSIPNFNCICKDELNARIINPIKVLLKNSPTNIIVNLIDSDKNVYGHWCLCFIDTTQNIYYLSYGDPIPIEVKQYMMEVED